MSRGEPNNPAPSALTKDGHQSSAADVSKSSALTKDSQSPPPDESQVVKPSAKGDAEKDDGYDKAGFDKDGLHRIHNAAIAGDLESLQKYLDLYNYSVDLLS